MNKQSTLSIGSTTKLFFLAALLCCTNMKSRATAWTTVAPGDIATLTSWTNGSSSPTSFFTPGDSWTITMAMTIGPFSTWILGTMSATAVNLTFAPGGDISSGSGLASPVITIYGNVIGNGGTYNVSGGGAAPVINVYGNTTIIAGSFTTNGGAAHFIYNAHGNFTMTGGDITVNGGGCDNRINCYGNCSLSGASALVSNGGGATGSLHFCRPASAGAGMIDNTSTGLWSAMDVFVDSNCKAQLDGNFTTSTGTFANGLTVYGMLICPAPDTITGTHKFNLNSSGTLIAGHANGIDGPLMTTGTITLNDTANYGFNGTVPQVTGMMMPASLFAHDTIIVNNNMGVTLSQNTATTGVLAFSSGILYTGSYTMTVPATTVSVMGAGATSYVDGTLVKPIRGLTSLTYEVGDSTYAPMTLLFTVADTGGSLGIKSTYGLHPSMGTSGLSAAHIVRHYWTITNYGAAGVATITPMATYNLADIIGGSNAYFGTQAFSTGLWLGGALPSVNTVSPYTSKPVTGVILSSLAGDYIYGRTTGTLDVPTVAGAPGLSIFPNPTTGTFNVQLATEKDEQMTVEVTNLVGEKVLELSSVTNKPLSITMNQAAGLYLVTVHTTGGVYISRVLVN